MSETFITLMYPVESHGVLVKEVHLRRPKVRDLEIMDKVKGGEVAKGIALVANLSELDPETIRDMDPLDFNKLAEGVGFFLGVTPTSAS